MLKKDHSYLNLSGYCLTIAFSLFFSISSFSQEEQNSVDDAVLLAGEKLFKANCTMCHGINDKLIGPALKGLEDRNNREWLISWVRNSQQLISTGDEYAVKIYEEYNKTAMPAYPFSDDQIISIIEYINAEANRVPEIVATIEGGSDSTTADSGVSQSYLVAILIILVVVLILILVVLGLIGSLVKKYLASQDISEEDSEIINQKIDVFGLLKSNGIIGLAIFIFVALVMKTTIDGLFTIGVQQGYMPTQPIAYSHKVHAGDFAIDCNYCHTGVRKSKSANIPSPNICMNCHVSIKNVKDAPGVSTEIQKLYSAVDFNPETGQYGTNTKPIEWVRVHNLPDLAYFNHAQHVEVGGVECQTCHGPIQEMEVVYQYANLTMGWCVNCHRETDVKTKGNEYYTKLVQLHSESSKQPMKVEDIGGLECGKCHY